MLNLFDVTGKNGHFGTVIEYFDVNFRAAVLYCPVCQQNPTTLGHPLLTPAVGRDEKVIVSST